MPLSWVRVQRQDGQSTGDEVFVGGAYEFPAGFLGTPFRTETGENTFETIDSDQTPVWRAVQEIRLADASNTPETAALGPVSTEMKP